MSVLFKYNEFQFSFFYKKDNGIIELENKINLFSMFTLQVEIFFLYTIIYSTEILYKLCVGQAVFVFDEFSISYANWIYSTGTLQ